MKITVMMVAYNAENYIEQCINSILSQTCQDFELLIIDDGSTDSTCEIISKISNPHIRVYKNKHDYIGSLNIGLSLSYGEYIARMDADDIMDQCRLEKQLAIMNKYPDIDVCATWSTTFGDDIREISIGNGFVKFPMIEFLLQNYIGHSTTMIRKEFLICHKILYKEYQFAEDYKLWVDIASAGGTFWIIPESLLKYRISCNQISHINRDIQFCTANRIRKEILLYLLNDDNIPESHLVRSLYLLLEKLNNKYKLPMDKLIFIMYSLLKEVITKSD